MMVMFLRGLAFLLISMFPNVANTFKVANTHVLIFLFLLMKVLVSVFPCVLFIGIYILLLVLRSCFPCHFMVYVECVMLSLL